MDVSFWDLDSRKLKTPAMANIVSPTEVWLLISSFHIELGMVAWLIFIISFPYSMLGSLSELLDAGFKTKQKEDTDF